MSAKIDLVIGARHAVFGAGRHHEPGKPAQIPQFRPGQFGSEVVESAHRTRKPQ